MLKVAITASNSMVPQNREYAWPVMRTSEFTLRSVSKDECDALIAQMKFLSAETVEDPIDCEVDSCTTDSDGIRIDDESEDSDDDDDDDDGNKEYDGDQSLTFHESYIRSGSMGGWYEPDEEDSILPEDVTTKRVRFATCPKDEVFCQKYENFNPPTKREMKQVWYKTKDFKRFRQENILEALEARETPYAVDFSAVYDACASLECLRALTPAHATAVAESACRGLEPLVFYSRLRAEKKSALARVRELQQSHTVVGSALTPAERTVALAAQCRALTKRARRLALVLAWGDAVVARGMFSPSEAEEIVAYNFVDWAPLAKPSDSIVMMDGTMCEI